MHFLLQSRPKKNGECVIGAFGAFRRTLIIYRIHKSSHSKTRFIFFYLSRRPWLSRDLSVSVESITWFMSPIKISRIIRWREACETQPSVHTMNPQLLYDPNRPSHVYVCVYTIGQHPAGSRRLNNYISFFSGPVEPSILRDEFLVPHSD